MNRFYDQSAFVKWSVGGALFFIPMGILIGAAHGLQILLTPYGVFAATVGVWLAIAALGFVFVPFLQTAFTPFLTLIGVYKYYSPMLMALLPTRRRVELHAGTWWDILYLTPWSQPGSKARRAILLSMLDGLLELADRIDRGEVALDAKIVGTSYFFNKSTIQRFGFRMEQPGLFCRFFLVFAILDITSQFSFTRGKLNVAPVWRARKATSTGAKLLANRENISRLRTRLAQRRRDAGP
ncbi:MAG: hypothetical protein HN348_11315 [Proteobacteria bacterium]|nr:hypothetical protein [Pseudomonadota bacterium]